MEVAMASYSRSSTAGSVRRPWRKTLRAVFVLAGRNQGRMGISFGRYGHSPERNGIPSKSFAIVASEEPTLEEGMAQYEPKRGRLDVQYGRQAATDYASPV
jgi:hypothetical protein